MYKTFYKMGLVDLAKMMSQAKPWFYFNTIGLFTTDNAKMVAFYRDIFGFKTEWNGTDPNVEMTLGDSRIIMFPRDAFEQMTSQLYAYLMVLTAQWNFRSMFHALPMLTRSMTVP